MTTLSKDTVVSNSSKCARGLTLASHESVGGDQNGQPVKAWQYSMSGHAEQCVERYLELSGKSESSLKQVATPCLDDHMFSPEEFIAKRVM